MVISLCFLYCNAPASISFPACATPVTLCPVCHADAVKDTVILEKALWDTS